MRDTSSVYHIDMLDAEVRENFSEDEPRVFETEGDLRTFPTEDQACAKQRSYRIAIGADPVTGE